MIIMQMTLQMMIWRVIFRKAIGDALSGRCYVVISMRSHRLVIRYVEQNSVVPVPQTV